MSNEIVFRNPNAVSTTVRRESRLAAAFANSSTRRRIALGAGGTFKRIVNGEQIGKAIRGEINVIIVSALPKVSREFYAKAYDPDGKATLPDCWSNLGDKPEAASPNPQARSCAECPQNVKGSGGGDRKACRYKRRIGVLFANDPSGDVYQFSVPAKSLFGKGHGNTHPFESYVKYLVANNAGPDTVVTNIAYDTEVDTVELIFSPADYLTDEQAERVRIAQDDPETTRLTMLTAAQADGVTAAPQPSAKAKITRAEEPDEDEDEAPAAFIKKAKPEIIDVDVEEIEEQPKPVKRVAKKAEAAPASKKNLSSVIDAWGDDEEDE